MLRIENEILINLNFVLLPFGHQPPSSYSLRRTSKTIACISSPPCLLPSARAHHLLLPSSLSLPPSLGQPTHICLKVSTTYNSTMQSTSLEFDPNHPLASFPPLVPFPPLRSPLRPPSKLPVIRCSLPTPPTTPKSLLNTPALNQVKPLPSSPPREAERASEPNRGSLEVDDRATMDELMGLPCSKEHCSEY